MDNGMHRALRLARRIPENHKTVSLVFDGSIPARPGQFVMAWLPGVDEKPFSVSACDPLTLSVARVGPFSGALHSLAEGERLWVRGPLGRGFSCSPEPTLLVGGGYGAAPLHFLARALLQSGCPRVEVALGARTAADLLFVERFRGLGAAVHPVTEDGSAGERGLVTGAAERLLAAGGFGRLCACGPGGMLDGCAELCRRAGIPAELSHEAYMRCGIGLCGACERDGRLVCLEGPVFMEEKPA